MGCLALPSSLRTLAKVCAILIVPVDIAQLVQQDGKADRIDSPVFFDAILGSLLELFKVPARLGNTNDRAGQLASFCQFLQ